MHAKTVKRAKIKLENTNNITIKTQYNKHFWMSIEVYNATFWVTF